MHPYQGQSQPTGPALILHTKYSWLAFILALCKPFATINGHQIQLKWGENVIPLQPGVYDVGIHVKYLWDIGKAQIQVDTTSGAPVQVYYAAPVIAFMDGVVDYQPVKPPAEILSLILFIAIPVVILLLCCCGVIGSSLGGS